MSPHSHAHPTGHVHTEGRVLHTISRCYDLMVWLMLRGRERAFRDKVLELVGVGPGDAVLDVGCGTGSLALRAALRVGLAGSVTGIDPSREMIAQARRKARKADADLVLETAVVEKLPFPDRRFDAVLSTLMLHHLPVAVREQAAREIRRVLKPGGRVIVVDFGGAGGHRRVPGPRKLLGHFHRHGHVEPGAIQDLLSGAGLEVVDSGATGFSKLHFVVARAP